MNLHKNALFSRIQSYLWLALLLIFGYSPTAFATYPANPVLLNDITGSSVLVATDNHNHALVVYNDITANDMQTYYIAGGNPISIPITTLNGFSYDLSMDPSGTALFPVADFNSGALQVAYWDGQGWIISSPDPITPVQSDRVGASMNGPGSGVVIWEDTSNNIKASFFNNGTWSAVATLGTGTNPTIAYSTNGTAVAGWSNLSNAAVVSNFIGGSWSAPVTLNSLTFVMGNVGIDAQGHALAFYKDDNTGAVVANYFNGSSWQPPQTLSVQLPDNFLGNLSMSSDGTAVATFAYNNTFFNFYHLYYAQFNGTSWEPTVDFLDNVNNFQIFGSVNGNGDAIIVWSNDQLGGGLIINAFVAQLPRGGVLSTPQQLQGYPFQPAEFDQIGVSYATNGYSVIAGWLGTEGFQPFTYPANLPDPPSRLKAKTCKDKFATQTARLNNISWVASTDPTVVSYYLYRNGFLIAKIPATGPFVYHDPVCEKRNVYSLVSVDSSGVPSDPINVIVK